MSDDLIDRVTGDLAAGRSVDWPAVIAAAATQAQRAQLESLRLIEGLRAPTDVTVSVNSAHDLVVGGPPAHHRVLSTKPVTWGRYKLLHEAGSGSFGTVYRAVDPDLQLDVAIKVLHRHVDNDVLREQLIKEGRALARIRHQNVVRVHGVEFNANRVGLCTEFIDGETLEAEVRTHGTFSQAQAIEVGEAVCQALAAVHRAEFVHRDIKARNVMRERDTGRIVLMDFGTGRELAQEMASPTFGLAGTAIYMAPEVLDNDRASPSSDVYSVGVLLYYVLTKGYPVEGASIEELRGAHRKGHRKRLGDLRPDLSPAFLRVIEKALAPKHSRYATPGALCGALEAVRTDRPRWIQWVKVAATFTAITLTALVVLGFINTYYFNSVLGRAGYVEEGLGDWLKWGAKGVVAPLVVAALTALGLTLALEFLQLVTRISGVARRAERIGAGLVRRWSLDDVATLSSVSFLGSAAVLFVTWWYFTPLLSTLTSISPDISSVAFEDIRLLSPAEAEYHLLYRKAFVGTTLACIMLWYPTLRLAVRTHQRIPRRRIIGGSIVLAFSLLLLDFPYRLLTQDIFFEEVLWQERACHVLAERQNERLIFCPSLPVPRNQKVAADTLTPVLSPEVKATEEGAHVKRRKSIFKFLLDPPAIAYEGRVP
jgi:eukaryotic-like serine/threonine-protein kinase